MQNWDSTQTSANYVEHNNWYNNMFAANIKTEPGTLSPTNQTQQNSPAPSSASSSNHMENFLKQQQQKQQQQFSAMDTNMTSLSPSPPTNSHNNAASSSDQQQQFFDTSGMHQQLMQQQQYQQQFQQAQQAAAQNQVNSHLPLGFNPLTPPGLPQVVLPAISHFYGQPTQPQRNQQQTPSPQTMLENSEKATLTPRHTPPMDITPPKSPKASNPAATKDHQQDQELMSNCSEDLKYIVDSEDDETIRTPIYNSHGKMKNYKCKSCGMVAITKLAFWEHAKIHMKPEKMLQCPKCPFVTELKHHLEYHIRKHKNLKPFQCDQCAYSCVNKSMLNSHRKSHSSVYQYRCSDCDYATKYCHSFKLHLRKYDHKPGIVLDEEGLPNPSVVIDVYGTRRGPKNKSSSGCNLKKSNTELKMSAASQLSAALQGFPINTKNPLPASPAKSNSSVASELPALTLNMSLQQQQQQQQTAASQISPSPQTPVSSQNGSISNLLPPLASLLQQNHNMAFFPYWNLQLMAAQQQAVVLAQLSPGMREQLQKYQQDQHNEHQQHMRDFNNVEEEDDEEEDDQELDRKSVDSAMDLSQGTPTKDEKQQQQQTPPDSAMNLKLPERNTETPVFSSSSTSRRKGRVLKLDTTEQPKANQFNSDAVSPQVVNEHAMPAASSPIATSAPPNKIDDPYSGDESMETGQNNHTNPSNTSATTTASSSGNSSNSSTTASSTANSTTNTSPTATPTMYECKYCDIFFKDAVLYTIHMGYHSCDDVFKCNMCGEKCDGPVGLFVHMARNAHS